MNITKSTRHQRIIGDYGVITAWPTSLVSIELEQVPDGPVVLDGDVQVDRSRRYVCMAGSLLHLGQGPSL